MGRTESDGTTLDTLSTYTYNSHGQVLTVTDATNGTTTYSYDPATGDLLSVAYPKNSTSGANPTYSYGRDTAGRVANVTDPLGKQTSHGYDNLDRITSVTLPKPTPGSPLNFITTYSYDNYDAGTGLVFINQTDPNGRVTKQGYDAYGQLVQSIDAVPKTTTFAYTKGLLTSITDTNNNVTSYSYNGLRRLVTTTFPDATTETYTYKPDGLLATKKDRKNQTITYNYDNLKRLASKVYPNSTSITYSYTGQKLMTVTDTYAGDTHTLGYDPSYRVNSNAEGTRGTLSYTYTAADQVNTYAVTGGPSATYAYYDDGSLNAIQWSAAANPFSYQYRLNGQYGTLTFPSGQQRSYTYDDQGRLTQVANTHPTAGNLGTFGYGYDSPLLGQRTSQTSLLGSTSYSYDTNYQLTQSSYPNAPPFNNESDSWTYDSIGTRLTNTVNGSTANYTYFKNGSNPLNGQRLQSDGTKTYTYDANGNITGDGTFTYTWDYENRLTGITGGGTTASYTYDYLGRRASKTVNSVITAYLYDGQNLVREATGGVTNDYVFGPGIDEPLALSRSGAVFYDVADGLGSITALVDASGTATDSYTYDAWGVLRSSTGTTPDSFGYTAREFAEAGLLYYRARYYNPSIGRFMSEDPNRFEAGINWYAYVENEPTSRKDPSGLFDIPSDFPPIKKPCCPLAQIDDLTHFLSYNIDRYNSGAASVGNPYAQTFCGWAGGFKNPFAEETRFYDPYWKSGGCVEICVQLHEAFHRSHCWRTGTKEEEMQAILLSIGCALKFLSMAGL